MYKNYIFDLDGTTLDTIEGIQKAVNEALKAAGFGYSFDKEGTKKLLGDGADVLVHRVLGEYDNEDNFLRLKKEYMPRYKLCQETLTFLFPHIKEVLEELKKKGAYLFVCTNKPNEYAKRIVDKLYGESLFTDVRGLYIDEAPKPNPDIPNYLLHKYQLSPAETLYVGDSYTDYLTAKGVGLDFAVCLWGYGFYNDEFKSKCDYLLSKPSDLLDC